MIINDQTVSERIERLLESAKRSPYFRISGVGSPEEVEGRYIVSLVLKGRRVEQLALEELACLAVGYCGWGKYEKQIEVYKLALSYVPSSAYFLWALDSAAWKFYQNEIKERGWIPLITMLEKYITEKVGIPEFWHLRIADYYEWIAVEIGYPAGYAVDWEPGMRTDPDALEAESHHIQKALEINPMLRQHYPDWWGDLERDWTLRYYVLSHEPKYQFLLPQIQEEY